ncbi:MAG: hypothetical protein HQL15_10070 [Candidatus Omnitrophica bacterium]|nr:hypothetical protein [Candidatus Omnitrophota bacterium]
MKRLKGFFLCGSVTLLAGCAGLSHHSDVYEEGYRRGVQEQIHQVAAEFQGGNFPYYHWTSPMVQDVRVPAHLSNGMMIPEHNELVIIKPGEWAMSPSYPIQNQQRKSYDNEIVPRGSDVSNITAMPPSVGRTPAADE